jgi:DNA-binding SARP family transcriptional activator
LHANEVVSTDRLIDELWGSSPPESAANMLQGYVSHLRKTLEPGRARGEHELLVSKAPGYMLRIDAGHVDAARFERLVDDGRGSLSNGDAAAAAERFRSALELWRGPALDDLAYEAFARADIERLEELRLQTLEDRIDAELALGRHGALVPELRELVDEHPLRERLRAQLMAALYRCGRQAHALEAYRDGRRVLHDELGIEPGPALRELEQAILRQDPALGAPTRPPTPAKRPRRRWLAPACIAAAIGAALAGGVVFGRPGGAKAVVVEPHSVAVIDPGTNSLAKDIPVGGYPGPLAADDEFIYVSNIGDATMSRIFPDRMKVYDTGSLSRATDLAAVDKHLWAADGGTPGHTPEPPGTVLNYDLLSASSRLIRVGPSVDGDEEQTTLAADGRGYEIWAGNKVTQTVTEVEPPTRTTVHGIVPGGLAVVGNSASSDTVWASDPLRDVVVRIDGDTGRVAGRIPVPGRPARIAADARAVWVIARDQAGSGGWQPTRGTAPAVWRIDPTINERVAKISLPLTPIRIALGEGSVWVTAMRVLSYTGSSADATVFRIDPASNRIVARIPLHTRAVDGILVGHGRVWVAVPASQ